MPFIKILVLLAHKEDFFRLILYLQRKFLHADYDSHERQIVIGFKRKCTFFIYFFTLFTLATVVSYIVNPLIGKSRLSKNMTRICKSLNWILNCRLFLCNDANFRCFSRRILLEIIMLLYMYIYIYLETSYSNVCFSKYWKKRVRQSTSVQHVGWLATDYNAILWNNVRSTGIVITLLHIGTYYNNRTVHSNASKIV